MPDIPNEPAAMMATLLSQIISDIKNAQPVKTDGTSGLTVGFVFSQQPIGQMVNPQDFGSAWTPTGGTPPAASGGSNVVPATPAGGGADPAEVARAKQAQEAAYNTCVLVDPLIMVTEDGNYQGWPLGRHLSIAYGQTINALETAPPAARSQAELDAIAAASKILYNTDPSGFETKTPVYKNYLANAKAYAVAKAAYADAAARALRDPAAQDTWPQDSVVLQQAVDDAFNTWKTEGALDVEAALATLESIGIPLEQGMIAKARSVFNAWQLGLAGVPDPVAYSFVLPSNWADPAADDSGWTHITVDVGSYQQHYTNNGLTVTTGNWSANSSSSSGEGGIGAFGLGFDLSHSESSSDSKSHTRTDTWNGATFHNDSKSLKIDLEYGLCEIFRPYLVPDLFYMKNYWVKGEKAKFISDGTLGNQVGKSEPPFIPMIPTHFLAFRNVTITFSQQSSDWDTLDHLFGQSDDQSLFTANSTSAGVAGVIGPIVFGGGGSHQESHFSASADSQAGHDDRSDLGVSWANGTLSIKGTQIAAWLSEIVPVSAPLDDPDLAKTGTPAPTSAAGGHT